MDEIKNITIEDDVNVEFSDPKSDWSEIVNFKDILNTIIEFIKKILAFEFDF